MQENDYFYADYTDIALDNPRITLNTWHTNTPAHTAYDTQFKNTVSLLRTPLIITLETTSSSFPSDAYCHVWYYRKSDSSPQHMLCALPNPNQKKTPLFSVISSRTHSDIPLPHEATHSPGSTAHTVWWIISIGVIGLGWYHLRAAHRVRATLLIAIAVCCLALAGKKTAQYYMQNHRCFLNAS